MAKKINTTLVVTGRMSTRSIERISIDRHRAKKKRIRLEVAPRDHAKPWQVTQDGKLYLACKTQADGISFAVDFAHKLADKGELVTLKIKRPDGRIRGERTYPRSSDPRRSKG